MVKQSGLLLTTMRNSSPLSKGMFKKSNESAVFSTAISKVVTGS